MDDLINIIKQLKNSEIKKVIDNRIKEFAQIQNDSIDKIFKELCFCVMTANCSANKCIEIHEEIGNDFLILSQTLLAEKFKELGYRFPNIRSQYIVDNRSILNELEKILKSHKDRNQLRDWLVKEIKGIGYKEASHFLRNIGYKDYAIIDFHIIDLLVKHSLIQKPKTMTKKKYLELEEILKDIGKKVDLNMAQLDLYLWYLETGKILK